MSQYAQCLNKFCDLPICEKENVAKLNEINELLKRNKELFTQSTYTNMKCPSY